MSDWKPPKGTRTRITGWEKVDDKEQYYVGITFTTDKGERVTGDFALFGWTWAPKSVTAVLDERPLVKSVTTYRKK